MPVDRAKIRKLRLEQNLTMLDAAKRAGLKTKQAWNNVESGDQDPRVSTLEKFARALGVKAKDLLI